MASQPPTRGREEDRRLSIRTLVIASVASAVAAVIASRFSTIGTPVAAAITPVIVALVSEMLHRPTERIAERVTRDRPRVLAEGMGGGPPDVHPTEALPERAPAEPGADSPPEPPVRVYGRSSSPRMPRRRVAIGAVLVTGLLGFAIAAIALTGADLATGGADRPTILGKKKNRDEPERTVPEQQTTPETVPQDKEAPREEEPPTPTAPQTTPTTPPTQPAPAPAPQAQPQQQQPPP